MRVLLIHGPNLNRLGKRDTRVYGTVTLDEIVEAVTARAREFRIDIDAFQSNHEGAGGLAHYSVALRDALEDTKLPVVEVHISDPAAREEFRHSLVTASAAARVITGKGMAGYLEALEALAKAEQ